jgi:uncharacterized repeat protein (TIGR01451 family)
MKKTIWIFLYLLASNQLEAQWTPLPYPGNGSFTELASGNGFVYGVSQNDGLFVSNSNGLNWQPVTSLPTNFSPFITSVDADDSGVVVLHQNPSGNTSISLSQNNGISWQELPGIAINIYSDEVYIGDGTIYAHSLINEALYRLDGSVWTEIFITEGAYQTVVVKGSSICLVSNGTMHFSPDKGSTWQPMNPLPGNAYPYNIAADATGILIWSANGLFRSLNTGVTWETCNIPGNQLDRLYVTNGRSYGFFNGALYRSDNYFQTYDLIWNNNFNLKDLAEINGFLVISSALIERSPLSNTTWTWVPVPFSSNFNQLDLLGNVLFLSSNSTMVSLSGGQNWEPVQPTIRLEPGVEHNGIFYARRSYTRQNWSSTDGIHWTVLPTLLPGDADSVSNFWQYIDNTAIHYSYFDPVIYTSTDDGANWNATGLRQSYTEKVFIHKNRLFSKTYENDKLMESFDFGANWSEVGSNTVSGYPYAETVGAANGKIYLQNSDFLLVSSDDGFSWTANSLSVITNPNGYIEYLFLWQNGILAKTTTGLFFSADDGQNWLPVGAGLMNIPSQEKAGNASAIWITDEKGRPYRRDNFTALVANYSGKVFLDDNNNSLQDIGELDLPGVVLELSGSQQYDLSDASGQFDFFAEQQTEQIVPHFPTTYCQFNPASYPLNGSNTALNFGLYCPPGIGDVSVDLTNSTVFRPGFETYVHVNVKNKGTVPATAIISLTLDPALMFIEATPTAFQSGSTLTWTLNDLPAFETATFIVKVKTDQSTPLGQSVCLQSDAALSVIDAQMNDNQKNICLEVVGSYDPNDKQVDPALLSPGDVQNAKPLDYTIRFQNTGTYPASFVVIRDTLSALLDPTTIEILSASHNYTWSLRGNGFLEFRFEGINLPDSSSDEAGSHGFIRFRIRPRSSIGVGASIPNTAHIYFDFNEAIVTNTISTMVLRTSAIENLSLEIWPNPATETLRIQIPKDMQDTRLQVQVWDAQGRTYLEQTSTHANNLLSIDLKNWPSGWYLLRCITSRGLAGEALFEVIR